MNIPFKIIHRRINISSSTVPWPHEQFARKKIFSATLSTREFGDNGKDQFSNIFDTQIDETILLRNINFIMKVLEAIMFDLPSGQVCNNNEQDEEKELK
jgi:hypothetical protein